MSAERARGGFALVAVSLLVVAAPAMAGDRAEGKQVFEERCSACHGENGFGDGPAASAIRPPPRNFHVPEFWSGRTPEQLHRAVKEGKGPTSMMPAFEGVLSDAQIDAVVDYLQSFRPAGTHAGTRHGQASGPRPGEDEAREHAGDRDGR